MPRFAVLACVLLGACGSEVTSEEEAELAYVGLDDAVDRALKLGLQGFNLADSANLDPQSEPGSVSGTMTITGQADQGNSDNKGLRLEVLLEGYSDLADVDDDENSEVAITYDTDPAALPSVDLQLRDIPTGTVEGTLVGDFAMEGDLEGTVSLDLSIAGELEEDPANAGYVRRVTGSTSVTGTATNEGGGTFEVDVTL